jgi:hypothetical protein
VQAKCQVFRQPLAYCYCSTRNGLRVFDAARAVKFFHSVADMTRIKADLPEKSYYGLDVVVVVVVWLGELPLLQVVVF